MILIGFTKCQRHNRIHVCLLYVKLFFILYLLMRKEAQKKKIPYFQITCLLTLPFSFVWLDVLLGSFLFFGCQLLLHYNIWMLVDVISLTVDVRCFLVSSYSEVTTQYAQVLNLVILIASLFECRTWDFKSTKLGIQWHHRCLFGALERCWCSFTLLVVLSPKLSPIFFGFILFCGWIIDLIYDICYVKQV